MILGKAKRVIIPPSDSVNIQHDLVKLRIRGFVVV